MNDEKCGISLNISKEWATGIFFLPRSGLRAVVFSRAVGGRQAGRPRVWYSPCLSPSLELPPLLLLLLLLLLRFSSAPPPHLLRPFCAPPPLLLLPMLVLPSLLLSPQLLSPFVFIPLEVPALGLPPLVLSLMVV